MQKISDYALMAEEGIRDLKLSERRPGELYVPASYGMQSGGKRLRPALTMMACEAFGGEAETALRMALGIEMFHNFTLLHDDVMDKSDMRRNRPTVYKKYGINEAILSGDTMLTIATQLVASVEDSKLRRVIEAFNFMALRVYEGQSLDMTFESRDNVTLDEYIDMVRRKTGALIGCAAEIGAIAGGASEEDALKCRIYGEELGVAFQIQDDLLDVFGDPGTFGKPLGGDICNNKKTYLYHTVMRKGGADAEALVKAMELPASDMKITAITRIFEKSGAAEDCRKAVAAYSSAANKAIKKTKMSDEGKDSFRALAEKLIGRRK